MCFCNRKMTKNTGKEHYTFVEFKIDGVSANICKIPKITDFLYSCGMKMKSKFQFEFKEG